MNTNEIMNDVDWKKDGEVGCLMSMVKIGAATIVLAIVMAVAFKFGVSTLVDVWWS